MTTEAAPETQPQLLRDHLARVLPIKQWRRHALYTGETVAFSDPREEPTIWGGWAADGMSLWMTDGCRHREVDGERLEFCVFVPPEKDSDAAALLHMIIAGQADPSYGGLQEGQVVKISDEWNGRWGNLTWLLVSLPYPIGPQFERAPGYRVLWLLPITEAEAKYAQRHSVAALEGLFTAGPLNFLDMDRDSIDGVE